MTFTKHVNQLQEQEANRFQRDQQQVEEVEMKSAASASASASASSTQAVVMVDHSEQIRQVITNHVPTATVLTNVGSEMAFGLPLEASAAFPLLLRELDVQRQALGVSDYGLSVTTLEEVFLKVAQEEDDVSTRKKHKEAVRKLSELGAQRARATSVGELRVPLGE